MLKKTPNRMCISCHEMKPKKELLRIVMNKQGEVSIDLTGKMQGRGAYLCNSIDCFKVAQKGKKLERTFKNSISEEIMEVLAKTIKDSG